MTNNHPRILMSKLLSGPHVLQGLNYVSLLLLAPLSCTTWLSLAYLLTYLPSRHAWTWHQRYPNLRLFLDSQQAPWNIQIEQQRQRDCRRTDFVRLNTCGVVWWGVEQGTLSILIIIMHQSQSAAVCSTTSHALMTYVPASYHFTYLPSIIVQAWILPLQKPDT